MHEAYSEKFVFYGCFGSVDSAKKPEREREREREGQKLNREKRQRKIERGTKRERQRRAVTSDAVCPHLISACFQSS